MAIVSEGRQKIHSLSKGIVKHPLVNSFLSLHYLEKIEVNPLANSGHLVGWGYKKSGLWAKDRALKKQLDFTLFEDGFVRSLFPGYKYGTVYSLVADSSGIYFDASGKSDLIEYLNGSLPAPAHWRSAPTEEQALEILDLLRSSGTSKYNCHLSKDRNFAKGVLVVDQTKGDAAIQFGGIEESDFDRLLKDAIAENPDSTIYVKTHPDHKYREKKSCFSNELLDHPSVQILPADLPPKDCFAFCDKIYVGSSLMGMEALIHNCHVITYAWNFYAGWGLTEDRSSYPKPPRAKKLSLLELFTASYLQYSHYFDPDTGAPSSLERIIEHISLQHKYWQSHQNAYCAYGLSLWKKSVLPLYRFPTKPSRQTKSIRKTNNAIEQNGAELMVWGKKVLPTPLSHHQATRIEDGFIRSRGLGAQFNFPLSWVFDDVGIYFDATAPSKLENLLQNHQFTTEELRQSKELTDFLREQKVTKYNLGIQKVTIPDEAKGKQVILVPGQVDSDASITYGSPKIRNNRELLDEVRKQNPDSYICYKPHPDLLAGARADAPLWDGIEQQVDHLVTNGDVISWIQAVDEVHTLTSTVGFEALLHNKPVFTYGLPFYSCWGLTNDWLSCERRTTERTFLELAAAAYILYPTYLNPVSGEFTTALNAAKIVTNTEFNHDSRPPLLKALGNAKSWFYKLTR